LGTFRANSGEEVMEAEENEDCLGDEEDAEAGWEAGMNQSLVLYM